MKIEILGSGCARCRETYDVIASYVMEKGLRCEIVKVESPAAIAAAGVLTTPAVVVDGKVVLKGKVPTRAEVQAWLG